MLYKIMDSIYSDKFIKFNGDEMNTINGNTDDGTTDYYIRDENNIFLFESKDFLIPAKIKRSYDFNEYEKILTDRLYYGIKRNGKEKKKAIKQLVSNIEYVLKKQLPFDQEYDSSFVNIYPIIIIHDYQYNIVGLSNLINHWAKDEFKLLLSKGINIDKVKPITIIDMDTFIFHQDLFRDSIKLNEVLDRYFEFITIDYNLPYTDEDYKSRMIQTLYPFATFLDLYIGKDNIVIPEMLSKKGFSLFL